MKKLPTHAAARPHLRMRKISSAGKSAFPPAVGAFSPDASAAFSGMAPPAGIPGPIGQ